MSSLKTIKRGVILVAGGTVLALGVALVVLPGPAFVVIPAGLAILAIEFAWARRWLQRIREWVQRARGIGRANDGVKAARVESAASAP
jgi:tellurite resistance protein TerC